MCAGLHSAPVRRSFESKIGAARVVEVINSPCYRMGQTGRHPRGARLRGAWIEHGPYIARTGQNTGPGTTVTINANGAFFRQKGEIYKVKWFRAAESQTGSWKHLYIGPYDGASLPGQVTAVLHELAHVINAIPGDDTSHIRSQQNTELVLQYCKSEVSASANRLRLVMTQSPAN